MAKNTSRKGSKTNVNGASQNSTAQYGDQQVKVGNGGETNQQVGENNSVLTTHQGTPVSDDQNSLKVGNRGPTIMEDFHFREKIFHFDHERIPEWVVHARGYGAHGFFETYKSLSVVTAADIFQRAGEQNPFSSAFQQSSVTKVHLI